MILTINYKNGTSETKIISKPHKGIEGENGDFHDVYEFDESVDLKEEFYKDNFNTISINSNASNIYIKENNANEIKVLIYSEESENYGGILSGADDGIEFRDEGYGFKRVVGGE